MEKAYFEYNDSTENPFYTFIDDTSSDGFSVDPHWHYYMELLYILEGSIIVYSDGKQHILDQGDLIILNAKNVHAIYAVPDVKSRYIVIKFDAEAVYSNTSRVFEVRYILPLILREASINTHYTKASLENTSIPSLILELDSEYSNKVYGYELAVQANICRLFLWILRNWSSSGLNSFPLQNNSLDISKFSQAFSYIDENFREPICAEHVANLCNMSYSYFSRQFKKIAGKSFTEYLNFLRITESEKLLLDKSFDIADIAVEVGFCDSSYFIKTFKKYKGVTPKQYKQIYIDSNSNFEQKMPGK